MKMKNLYFVAYSAMVILLYACSENDLPTIEHNDFEVGFCHSYVHDGRYVIDDTTQYKSVMETFYMDTLNYPECQDSFLISINFEKKTLLGYRVCGSGCETIFTREVFLDEPNQKYVYEVLVKEVGACEPLRCQMNWVLVPKLPEGYFVEFL
jgi:hypothetical protein